MGILALIPLYIHYAVLAYNLEGITHSVSSFAVITTKWDRSDCYRAHIREHTLYKRLGRNVDFQIRFPDM